MATYSISIPDDQVTRVVESLSSRWGYQEFVEGAPNPETRTQFVKRQFKLFLRKTVVEYEEVVLKKAAVEAVVIPAEPDIDVT